MISRQDGKAGSPFDTRDLQAEDHRDYFPCVSPGTDPCNQECAKKAGILASTQRAAAKLPRTSPRVGLLQINRNRKRAVASD